MPKTPRSLLPGHFRLPCGRTPREIYPHCRYRFYPHRANRFRCGPCRAGVDHDRRAPVAEQSRVSWIGPALDTQPLSADYTRPPHARSTLFADMFRSRVRKTGRFHNQNRGTAVFAGTFCVKTECDGAWKSAAGGATDPMKKPLSKRRERKRDYPGAYSALRIYTYFSRPLQGCQEQDSEILCNSDVPVPQAAKRLCEHGQPAGHIDYG